MKSALTILLLGLVGFPGSVAVHGEALLEPPGQRRHLGFVLAQGPSGEPQPVLPGYSREQGTLDGEFVLAQGSSGEPQPVLPGYSREQGALDGEIAAEFKGTRWWWVSGFVCGFSIVGLFVCDGYTPSEGSVTKKEYQAIRGRGVEYVQGYREGHGRHFRKRRAESRDDGFFWGLVSVLGVVAVKGTLGVLD